MRELPSGEVTFCFTDIEGSTALSVHLGEPRFASVIERHREILRGSWRSWGGAEVGTEGDGCFVVFAGVDAALAACLQAQRELALEQWPEHVEVRVRMGVHTGQAVPTVAGDYIALAVNQAARVATCGHGGQVVVSEMDGVEATRRITTDARLTSTRVLVLTTFDLDEYVFDAIRAGASGFLLKDTLPGELLSALRVVAGGEALLAPTVTRRLIEEIVHRPATDAAAIPVALAQLTPRETEVLRAVAGGLSNMEIAHTLSMSHATAKSHVSRLLTKLHARDRAQLVMMAYEAGVARRSM